jgi:NitT/TauT family transport system ATP-binding protein
MSLSELKLPDYREQSPAVAARFERIRQREVILRVSGLKKCFGTNGNTQVVFDNVSLDIHRREFICVVGASGCGKSTLARIVAGLDEATAGAILLNEKPVNGPGPDRGMVFQGYTLFPWLSVCSNVMFGLKMHGKDDNTAKAEARQWLDMVGLSKFENAYPHELSGGMKQRVAVARAFAVDPPVLYMDEPFGALDEQTRVGLANELMALWERTRKTVVFVTHGIEEAVTLADRVVVLSAHPGTVKAIVPIDFARPRDAVALRGEPKFGEYVVRIWGLLR